MPILCCEVPKVLVPGTGHTNILVEQDQKCRNIHRNDTCVAIAIFKR